MKTVSILGSTGSIGTQALSVLRAHPGEFRVCALSCNRQTDLIEDQIREFSPDLAVVSDEEAAADLRVRVADTATKVTSGMEGLIEAATLPECDLVLTALVGMIGIRPALAAIRAGKDLALANKETCVCAGHIILPLAKEKGVRILPVDSEHSAIFQALYGHRESKLRRILLTASGGPFFEMDEKALAEVTVKDALAHPNWSMGDKITIDSASMVNKGLEVIEAKWLFDADPEQIEVVIQRESLIHSAVEYEDGSILAQMGPSDMRIPIQYALTFPEHKPCPAKPLDFSVIRELRFDRPRDEVFRGLPLAREALFAGGSMPTVYNAANEWANAAFRSGKIGFLSIYEVIEESMAKHQTLADPDVDTIEAIQEQINEEWNARYGGK